MDLTVAETAPAAQSAGSVDLHVPVPHLPERLAFRVVLLILVRADKPDPFIEIGTIKQYDGIRGRIGRRCSRRNPRRKRAIQIMHAPAIGQFRIVLMLFPFGLRFFGGTRLLQSAEGYAATIVRGIVTRENDAFTGERPGRLVRS